MSDTEPSPDQIRALRKRLCAAMVSRPYAIQLSTGQRTPSFNLARRLHSELGIPPEAWRLDQPPVIDWSGL